MLATVFRGALLAKGHRVQWVRVYASCGQCWCALQDDPDGMCGEENIHSSLP